MAEVSRAAHLDVLHVHYAVPHATAALLARAMLPPGGGPRIVTTLHGTDTTLLGRDPGYGPAITHALMRSDAVTTVSAFLAGETRRLLAVDRPIDVIHNFFAPRPARRTRLEVRRELGVGPEPVIVHASNLRPLKRIDLLLEAVARIRPTEAFALLILAGGDFAPYAAEVRRLGLAGRVIVRSDVTEIEDYLQASDLGLFTSETESFCLSLLEAMFLGVPSVATAVGGIPEVMVAGTTGVTVPFGDADGLARALESLLHDPERRARMGAAARQRATGHFSADTIVPQYEALYRRVCAAPPW
jgi:N-acetyl-alpha-D-glucosaminyl L-malate synthase BshA